MTTVMHEIILGDEMPSDCLWCRYIKMVACTVIKYCMAVYCMEVLYGSFARIDV